VRPTWRRALDGPPRRASRAPRVCVRRSIARRASCTGRCEAHSSPRSRPPGPRTAHRRESGTGHRTAGGRVSGASAGASWGRGAVGVFPSRASVARGHILSLPHDARERVRARARGTVNRPGTPRRPRTGAHARITSAASCAASTTECHVQVAERAPSPHVARVRARWRCRSLSFRSRQVTGRCRPKAPRHAAGPNGNASGMGRRRGYGFSRFPTVAPARVVGSGLSSRGVYDPTAGHGAPVTLTASHHTAIERTPPLFRLPTVARLSAIEGGGEHLGGELRQGEGASAKHGRAVRAHRLERSADGAAHEGSGITVRARRARGRPLSARSGRVVAAGAEPAARFRRRPRALDARDGGRLVSRGTAHVQHVARERSRSPVPDGTPPRTGTAYAPARSRHRRNGTPPRTGAPPRTEPATW